ncbi:hypothetical protein ACRS5S_02745 [Nocardia asiatica]|uniref:hypothetical protein n=1 Tax=Nocardia asiatica TaxID=209252 RepID=UPI003EE07489
MLAYRECDGSADSGVGGDGLFDFAEFDAVSADFDLAVGAAEEFQYTVGVVSAQIAGAVPALACLFEERGAGAFGIVAVASGHAETADE